LDEVVEILRLKSKNDEALWNTGKISGTVYHGGAEIQTLLEKAYGMFSLANPLHSDLFNNCRNMEAEVITMVGTLFGHPGAAGCMTMGGTESILMAVKAARDWGREERGITSPNIIVPVTVH